MLTTHNFTRSIKPLLILGRCLGLFIGKHSGPYRALYLLADVHGSLQIACALIHFLLTLAHETLLKQISTGCNFLHDLGYQIYFLLLYFLFVWKRRDITEILKAFGECNASRIKKSQYALFIVILLLGTTENQLFLNVQLVVSGANPSAPFLQRFYGSWSMRGWNRIVPYHPLWSFLQLCQFKLANEDLRHSLLESSGCGIPNLPEISKKLSKILRINAKLCEFLSPFLLLTYGSSIVGITSSMYLLLTRALPVEGSLPHVLVASASYALRLTAVTWSAAEVQLDGRRILRVLSEIDVNDKDAGVVRKMEKSVLHYPASIHVYNIFTVRRGLILGYITFLFSIQIFLLQATPDPTDVFAVDRLKVRRKMN